MANSKRDARLELISKIIGSRRAFFSLTEEGGNDDGSNERIYPLTFGEVSVVTIDLGM